MFCALLKGVPLILPVKRYNVKNNVGKLAAAGVFIMVLQRQKVRFAAFVRYHYFTV
jgi:hypothetical protein